MKRFSRILALHDPMAEGSAALDRAVEIAKADGSRLTVLRIIEEFPQRMLAQNPSLAVLWNEAVQEAGAELQQVVSGLKGQGLDADAKVVTGVPFIEAIREVLMGGYDLLVKSSEGRGRLRSMFLGSNDMHLLRKCSCPVLILRHPKRNGFKRILAAVDPDPFNEERDRLNLKIMELAISFAKTRGAKLIIVHAWGLFAEGLLRARSIVSHADLESHLNQTHALHKKRLKELISGFDLSGVRYETHLLKGEPWKIIASQGIAYAALF